MVSKNIKSRIFLIIIGNTLSITVGYYIFFYFFRPIVVSTYRIFEGDVFFDIYYIIYFILWEASMICFISTSIRSIYSESSKTLPYKMLPYYILLTLGFFLELPVLLLTPKYLEPFSPFEYNIFEMLFLDLIFDIIYYFIVFLPWIIGFLSHTKGIFNILAVFKELESNNESNNGETNRSERLHEGS